ncbi:FKBP-type peptidyl-prolyl cis-trans isomerase [Ectopseudomonas oleovorans]|uniref:Peptidyl-prolyl cis-trans isomerase n=1 Tax=Ectopseudomonas oleovorans TaxID=301 RepID=A0A3R8W8U1_ECTOL|nr:FKBP-type peptidyl-prolyl cis-trans isomerase [Pseudomonas oleovorans]RRW36958.1 FKBP-type peptidyl-prolyl cis-trans isomerase [Pseudomonas oleovorans]
MSRAVLAVLAICSSLGVQADQHQQDLAYSLGVRLGERLHEEVPDLPLSELLEGLRQAYEGKPLRLDAGRIEQLLDEHEARIEASPQRHTKAIETEQRFLAEQRRRPDVRALANGVLVTELSPGSGPTPTARSRVQVSYRGELADGSVFDESSTPQWFRLDSLIGGWRSALLQMPKGAHWRLVIPSDQAYGEEGAGDLIPPYAPLVFDLRLLDVAD